MTDFLPSVTVEEFKNIVKRQFQAGLPRPIFGLGKGGIGKTESIADLAKNELNIGYIDIRLLLYSETDLKGVPYVNQEHTHTIWLQNDILPRVERDGEQGILVLDEVTSCGKSVRTAAYQLLNEGRLGEYVLPSGWMIVCLGNGEEDGGGEFTGIEGNFANRCSVFEVVADLEAWKTWAYTQNIHPLVLAYLSWCPQHLHTFDWENEEFLFASPRSWKAVSDILHLFPVQDPLTTAQINANVGRSVGGNFLAFCQVQAQVPKAKDILKGENVPHPQSQEGLLLQIQGVIYLLRQTIEEANCDFSAPELPKELLESVIYGVNWMLSLERVEHQMMAIKDFMASHNSNTQRLFLREEFTTGCPKLMEFIEEHHEILGDG